MQNGLTEDTQHFSSTNLKVDFVKRHSKTTGIVNQAPSWQIGTAGIERNCPKGEKESFAEGKENVEAL